MQSIFSPHLKSAKRNVYEKSCVIQGKSCVLCPNPRGSKMPYFVHRRAALCFLAKGARLATQPHPGPFQGLLQQLIWAARGPRLIPNALDPPSFYQPHLFNHLIHTASNILFQTIACTSPHCWRARRQAKWRKWRAVVNPHSTIQPALPASNVDFPHFRPRQTWMSSLGIPLII
jgi:hypothetical protein